MNFSELKNSVYKYLSYTEEAYRDIDDLIRECIFEIEKRDSFRAINAEYDQPQDFLKKEPYTDFLSKSNGYFLIAATLGAEIDRDIKRLFLTNMRKASVFDASANAYLEYKAEKYKKELYPILSYTFCPGYQGTRVKDLRPIFEILKPERIGISLTDTNMMIPQKSIVGIAAKDVFPKLACIDCEERKSCTFGKRNAVCKRSVKK